MDPVSNPTPPVPKKGIINIGLNLMTAMMFFLALLMVFFHIILGSGIFGPEYKAMGNKMLGIQADDDIIGVFSDGKVKDPTTDFTALSELRRDAEKEARKNARISSMDTKGKPARDLFEKKTKNP